jgi:hypothetical protein
MAKMTVIIDGKKELREIDRYEMPLENNDIMQPLIAIPRLRQNEEILRTFDGETIIIKKL